MREKLGGYSGKRGVVSEIRVDREKEQRRDGKAGTRMWTGRGDAEVSGVAESERREKEKQETTGGRSSEGRHGTCRDRPGRCRESPPVWSP